MENKNLIKADDFGLSATLAPAAQRTKFRCSFFNILEAQLMA